MINRVLLDLAPKATDEKLSWAAILEKKKKKFYTLERPAAYEVPSASSKHNTFGYIYFRKKQKKNRFFESIKVE